VNTLDILAAEADLYDERLDRVLRQYRREHDATFAADLDIQYPCPVARTTDEMYRDVMAWITGLPRQASPWEILHAPRAHSAPVGEPDVVVAVQITTEQAEQIRRRRKEREITLTALVERNRPLGWKPRPEDFGLAADENMPGRDALMMPRPVEQAGPQGRFARWLDEQLQHGERWWRRKQAARDARMGLED
jgi:hypothetical protein